MEGGFPAPPRGTFCAWLDLADLDATRSLGAWLATQAGAGDTILLEGELGAGKTSLVQGLARALGVDDAVTSPTFALCNILAGSSVELHHYDLYRVESPERLLAIGFEESLDSEVIVLVEWPALGEAFYRGKILGVRLEHAGNTRRACYGWMEAQRFFST